jgi:hypothetical protein
MPQFFGFLYKYPIRLILLHNTVAEMFRQSKEEGYEVVAITLAALLIFSTLFLTENRAVRERENAYLVVPETSQSITQTTVYVSEGSKTSDTLKDVSSTVPELAHIDLVTTTMLSDKSPMIPGSTLPKDSEVIPEKVLDDLEIDACTAADENGACRTKLYDLGIVDIDDCCKYLGRCCL